MADVFLGMWVVSYRELLRFIQERTRLFSSLAMPLLLLVIFGAGFNRITGAMTPGVNFIQFMYPGIIAMTVLMNSLMSGLSVVWDREFGFLKEILVAPLGRSGIVLGKAAGSATVAVVQGIVMLVLAPFLGVSLSPLLVIELIPVANYNIAIPFWSGCFDSFPHAVSAGISDNHTAYHFPSNLFIRRILPGE